MITKGRSNAANVFTSPYFFALLTYLVLGLLLLKYFHYITYKDEVNYISIAEKYARGDFLNAPNALWPPLLEWLLAGLLLLGLPSVLAAKLLSLMIGVFTFFSARSLSYVFEMSDTLRSLLFLLLVPVLLYFSLVFFTPDLLLVGLLTFYFSVILSRKYSARPYAGYLCGLLGALCYFCKSYALYFFIFHFLLLNVIHYFINAEKPLRVAVLLKCAGGLAIIAFLAAGWIYMLNRKYHEVTVGVAGNYNQAIRGPKSEGRPITYVGFMPPHDATAVSIWEDPYYLMPYVKRWSPLDSWSSFRHEIKMILANIDLTVNLYQRLSILSVTIIVVSLLLCLGPLETLVSYFQLASGLMTLCLYPVGYMMIHIEERYLWPMQPLLMCMAGQVLYVLFKTQFFSQRARKGIALALLSASFLYTPLIELYTSRNNAGKSFYTISRLLENDVLNGAKIASDTQYEGSVILAYYLKARYYGTPKPSMPENELIEELKRNGINYYFVWEREHPENAALKKIRDLKVEDQSVSVYSVTY